MRGNVVKKTHLGKGKASKTDEFSEKFQTAFDPLPPSFSENYVEIFFSEISEEKRLYKGPKSAT